jgi:hypothetical protein
VVLCVAVLSGLLSAGCSGLQAERDTALAIDRDAVAMALPADDPLAALESDAERFRVYHETATVNLLAYWFDADKTIYCTAAIYESLYDKADRSGEHLRRFRAATQPASAPASMPSAETFAAWRALPARWMANIKREKDGR